MAISLLVIKDFSTFEDSLQEEWSLIDTPKNGTYVHALKPSSYVSHILVIHYTLNV